TKTAMIPSAKPTSPTRLTMNAFLAARLPPFFRDQNPLSRGAQQPPRPPPAVDDERLLGREARAVLAEPEPDEQVAAQADELPRDEQREPAVRQDEQQHREHEQVQVREEAPLARVVGHVADRVDVDQHADRRDDDQQRRRQAVDEEAG